MAKEPRTNWNAATRAELLQHVKALNKRIAKLEAQAERAPGNDGTNTGADLPTLARPAAGKPFPWSLPNAFEEIK